jgi:hypothetical protein
MIINQSHGCAKYFDLWELIGGLFTGYLYKSALIMQYYIFPQVGTLVFEKKPKG